MWFTFSMSVNAYVRRLFDNTNPCRFEYSSRLLTASLPMSAFATRSPTVLPVRLPFIVGTVLVMMLVVGSYASPAPLDQYNPLPAPSLML